MKYYIEINKESLDSKLVSKQIMGSPFWGFFASLIVFMSTALIGLYFNVKYFDTEWAIQYSKFPKWVKTNSWNLFKN